MSFPAYDKLIALLDENGADYSLIDHSPEGQTDVVSELRGNDVSDAAKCMVVMVKIDKKTKHFVLAVTQGSVRVDLNVVKKLFGATYVSFASPEIAEDLAGSEMGTVLPFSFDSRLELIADIGVTKRDNLYFNAARLDRSMRLSGVDYLKLSGARIESIAQVSEPERGN